MTVAALRLKSMGVTFQGLTPLAIHLRRVAAKENTVRRVTAKDNAVFRVAAKDNAVRRVAAIESIQSAIWRSYFIVLGVHWN
jgi:hypothetical protein